MQPSEFVKILLVLFFGRLSGGK
ncbi:MAG: hypothetical protein RQM92_10360 [Candidatus Syntrophopropionicum ammoniitolerans]